MQRIDRARDLRKRMTNAEWLLWHHLRGRRFFGHKFRRQVPIGPYIVDFVCIDARLIIEVDGGQHALQLSRDAARDKYLLGKGFLVLRFWNNEVLGNIEGVLTQLLRYID